MSPEYTAALVLLGSMLALFAIGMPVAFSIGLSAALYMLASPAGSLLAMPQRMINGIDSFTLMAIPFFVLAGELMNTGGITRRIFRFTDDLVGHLKCGLGYVNVVANMIFAGMSGSAVADASGLGAVVMDAMEKRGYERNFSAALTAAASTIGPLIPPSIPFVIYGSVTSVSIGRLLLAGAIPGFLLGGSLMLFIYCMTRRKDFPRSHPSRPSLSTLARSFADAFPALLTPIILVGGIVSGLFTPTEASATACAYALVLGLMVYKEFTLRHLASSFLRTALFSAEILFIISTATFFGLVLAKAQFPQLLMDTFANLHLGSNIYGFLIGINVLLLIMGCVIDTNPILIVFCPLLVPMTEKLGIDPVYFGVLIVFNLMLALLTPPVGMVTYTVLRVSNCSLGGYTRALMPFLAVMIFDLAILIYFPSLSTFLPNLLLGAR
ncbi:MAG: TRAP transporter large permease [candidate division NC10 bacterium]|nr:TRAP transporter large permease [candidate division NC10 bacterium]